MCEDEAVYSDRMFSGITQAVSPVISAATRDRCRTVRIKAPHGWKLSEGQSVSINGICSTVTRRGKDFFEVEYTPTTLAKATASAFTEGSVLNLERSLKLSDYVDGHFVAGHVDATTRVISFKHTGAAGLLVVELPKSLKQIVATRGSVALNGVSLTVAEKKAGRMTIALVPHTLKHTNLGTLKKGDRVNVEADMLARLTVAADDSGSIVTHNATKRIHQNSRAPRRSQAQSRNRAR